MNITNLFLANIVKVTDVVNDDIESRFCKCTVVKRQISEERDPMYDGVILIPKYKDIETEEEYITFSQRKISPISKEQKIILSLKAIEKILTKEEMLNDNVSIDRVLEIKEKHEEQIKRLLLH